MASSSKEQLDLNTDIMSENQTEAFGGVVADDDHVSGVFVDDEIRDSGGEKVMASEPVIHVSVEEGVLQIAGGAEQDPKTEIGVVRVERAVKTTETSELLPEVELAAARNEEVISNLEENSSLPDKGESAEVEGMRGSAEENAINETEEGTCQMIDSMLNEESDTVRQVGKAISDRPEESGILNHVRGNSDARGPLAEGATSVSEVDRVIFCESVSHLENVGGDSKVQFAVQKRTTEPEIEAVEEAVVSGKQGENHVIASDLRIPAGGQESNMDTIVAVGSYFNGEAKENNGVRFVGKDVESHSQGVGGDTGNVDELPFQDQFVKNIEHESHDDLRLVSLGPESPFEKEHLPNCLKLEKEKEFLVSDLVWGKVRSHPWWPGQIFDPSDASEQAMKYHKQDRFLVAYFGDQTFAWNEASSLKPFRTHFSQMEKQSSLDAFRAAVGSALDEVSRRVQSALSCSCTPEEVIAKIKLQAVQNSGIREEICRRDGVDNSFGIASFEPHKLMDYVKTLALDPCSGGNLLELVITRAQLLAFYCWKGYFWLPEFHLFQGLLGNDVENATQIRNNEEQALPGKRKMRKRYNSFRRSCEYILEDDMNPNRKRRSLWELMNESNTSSGHVNGLKYAAEEKGACRSASASSGNKRKVGTSFSNEGTMHQRKKAHFGSRKSDTETLTPSSSKVGERIRRIASQLTGSSPALSYSDEEFTESVSKIDHVNDKAYTADVSPRSRRRCQQGDRYWRKHSAPDEMLPQLCLAARDPMKGYSFLSTIVDFFTDYRNSIRKDDSGFLKTIVSAKSGGRDVRPSKSKTKSHGTYHYKSVNECYLSDENIQSSQEEQNLSKNHKRKRSSQLETPTKKKKLSTSLQPKERSTVDPENHFRLSSPEDSKQQSSCGNTDLVVESETSPTALILNFNEAKSILSEVDLNKIFSRFGVLREAETEIMRKSKSAKVVFQRRNDAEVAFSSAGKFSIFGPTLVSYQLRYLTSTPPKASPRATRQSQKN